jgi:hypothetical protein
MEAGSGDISGRRSMTMKLHIQPGDKSLCHIYVILVGSVRENVVFVCGYATKALDFVREEDKIVRVVPEKGIRHRKAKSTLQ